MNEMHQYISRLENYNYDLYITIPQSFQDEQKKSILTMFPNAYIKDVPNKGLDIGAFMNIINDIDLDKYDICFKVHTKRSMEYWRRNLLDSILMNDNRIKQVIDILMLGNSKMVGCACWIVSYMGYNRRHYDEFCKRFSFGDNSIKPFVGGTMFACTSDIIKEIKSKNISQDEFKEGYVADGRKEHAFERIFGKIVYERGSTITAI